MRNGWKVRRALLQGQVVDSGRQSRTISRHEALKSFWRVVPEYLKSVRRLSSGPRSDTVETIQVDLADLDSTRRLCDFLREQRVRLDIAVLNAGLSTVSARRSKQGFEMMFAVHFLANRYLVQRFLEDGVVKPATTDSDEVPRLIFVSSEAHRSGESFDFSDLGTFHEFGRKDALRYYGISKMVLSAYACELSKRLNPTGTRIGGGSQSLSGRCRDEDCS